MHDYWADAWGWVTGPAGKSHGITQASAGLFSFSSGTGTGGYLLAAALVAVLTQVAIGVREEITSRRRSQRHREDYRHDLDMWGSSNRFAPVPVPPPVTPDPDAKPKGA